MKTFELNIVYIFVYLFSVRTFGSKASQEKHNKNCSLPKTHRKFTDPIVFTVCVLCVYCVIIIIKIEIMISANMRKVQSFDR